MKVLFSSSEGKCSSSQNDLEIHLENLFGSELISLRKEIIISLNNKIEKANDNELKKIFSTTSLETALGYKKEYVMNKRGLMAAINRYTGVGFQALDYERMDKSAKSYIRNNVLIFSNIYGPLLPMDQINDYKYKQGEKIGSINPSLEFGKQSKDLIDSWIGSDLVLDLRSSAYKGFYQRKIKIVTVDFLIDGKMVSHYAKKYRGILLREMAIHKVGGLDELLLVIKNMGKCNVVKNSATTKISVELERNLS